MNAGAKMTARICVRSSRLSGDVPGRISLDGQRQARAFGALVRDANQHRGIEQLPLDRQIPLLHVRIGEVRGIETDRRIYRVRKDITGRARQRCRERKRPSGIRVGKARRKSKRGDCGEGRKLAGVLLHLLSWKEDVVENPIASAHCGFAVASGVERETEPWCETVQRRGSHSLAHACVAVEQESIRRIRIHRRLRPGAELRQLWNVRPCIDPGKEWLPSKTEIQRKSPGYFVVISHPGHPISLTQRYSVAGVLNKGRRQTQDRIGCVVAGKRAAKCEIAVKLNIVRWNAVLPADRADSGSQIMSTPVPAD